MNVKEAFQQMLKAGTPNEAFMALSELHDALGVHDIATSSIYFTDANHNLSDADCAWFTEYDEADKANVLRDYIELEVTHFI